MGPSLQLHLPAILVDEAVEDPWDRGAAGADQPPLRARRREDQRLRRADAYLRSQLAEPISLSCLAQVAGLSRFHLLRLFKIAYGETPLKRLTRLRIGPGAPGSVIGILTAIPPDPRAGRPLFLSSRNGPPDSGFPEIF